MASDIRDRVIGIIAQQVGTPKADIHEGAHLLGDLGADSLDLVEIVLELEEEFDVDFDEQGEPILVVGQVIDYIRRRL